MPPTTTRRSPSRSPMETAGSFRPVRPVESRQCRMPFAPVQSFVDIGAERRWRERLAGTVPGSIAVSTGSGNVVPAVATAVGPRPEVFEGAFEPAPQRLWDLLLTDRAKPILRPHQKPAIAASPILLDRESGSHPCYSLGPRHSAHPSSFTIREADVQQPPSDCPSFGRDHPRTRQHPQECHSAVS